MCPPFDSVLGSSSSVSSLGCSGCPLGAASRRFTRGRKSFAISVAKDETNRADYERAEQWLFAAQESGVIYISMHVI